jgi:hypothetical protein
MKSGHGFRKALAMGKMGRCLASLAILLLLPACPQAGKSEDEMRKEIQGLKADIETVKEKLTRLEAGQKSILEMLKRPVGPAEAGTTPSEPPEAPRALSVGQLIKEKDRYLGTRVTVNGPVGPVLMHHKSLLLKSPEGMVEVFFGNIQDKRVVDRLTSMPLDHPITVTGMASVALKGGAKLSITAEAVEF